MLNAYLAALQALIQAPSAPNALVSTASQTNYINTARQQVAGDGECVRCTGLLGLSNGVQAYSFSLIVGYSLTGVTGTLAVREGFLGGKRLDFGRSWEWFSSYYLFSGNTGIPVRMAQQAMGQTGVLYFDPIPNSGFTVGLDVVGVPAVLSVDGDPEAIPYPWTDAVPFYAAWLALMSLQRQNDADKMYARYLQVMKRARSEATPTVFPDNMPGGAGAQSANAKINLGAPVQGAR